MSAVGLVSLNVYQVIMYDWRTKTWSLAKLEKDHVYIAVFNCSQKNELENFLKLGQDKYDILYMSFPALNTNYPKTSEYYTHWANDTRGRNVVVVFEWKECHRIASDMKPVQTVDKTEKILQATT